MVVGAPACRTVVKQACGSSERTANHIMGVTARRGGIGRAALTEPLFGVDGGAGVARFARSVRDTCGWHSS
jgi:hypothetical protein